MEYWDMVIRIGLIIVLSAAIGLDRELRHKPAGIKTHILVGLGSTIFMLVSLYIYHEYGGEAKTVDPGRIAAQVVTGIGFLGAGTIMQSKGSVTGLTTAASLWAVAGIGLAVGAGMYALSVTLAAAIIVVFLVTNTFFGIVGHRIEEIEMKKKDLESRIRELKKKKPPKE
ncbi:MAG TPA: MgtC/SapB family protein [Firmicutes bacterium]|nr:MgtC/SapB family protein [Bacillota bacterium]